MVGKYHIGKDGGTYNQYGIRMEYDRREHERRFKEVTEAIRRDRIRRINENDPTSKVPQNHNYRKPPVKFKG